MEFGPAIGYGVPPNPTFWIGQQQTGDGFRETHIASRRPTAPPCALSRPARDAGAEVLHEPRLWPEYHADYYGALVRDPDGNNVEAVCHSPSDAQRRWTVTARMMTADAELGSARLSSAQPYKATNWSRPRSTDVLGVGSVHVRIRSGLPLSRQVQHHPDRRIQSTRRNAVTRNADRIFEPDTDPGPQCEEGFLGGACHAEPWPRSCLVAAAAARTVGRSVPLHRAPTGLVPTIASSTTTWIGATPDRGRMGRIPSGRDQQTPTAVGSVQPVARPGGGPHQHHDAGGAETARLAASPAGTLTATEVKAVR